jgi:membrane protease YdiL (CAAX protease family)
MKRNAWISLLLFLPAPSIGLLFGMILLPGTPAGQGVFIFSKLWILLLPALWFFFVETGRMPRGKTERGGFRMGVFSGLAISAFVISAYLLLGRRMIDSDFMRDMAAGLTLDRKATYIGASLYWIFINSVLEEYVWRWFAVRQCAKLMKPPVAIVVSALGFTLHHTLAMQVYFSSGVTVASALCILFASMLWSWMFLRYKTIWPSWLSHALVDTAVFGIGYTVIFG